MLTHPTLDQLRALRLDGMVQAFRRADCTDATLTVKLHGLQSAAEYVVADLDEPSAPRRLAGATRSIAAATAATSASETS